MSWSFQIKGRAAKVASEVAARVDGTLKYVTDEKEQEQVRQAGELAKFTLGSFTNDHPVEVEASGSLSMSSAGNVYSVSVKVTPLWGWVE